MIIPKTKEKPITMKTIEEVREIFKNDRFATENGAYIEEIGEKYAKCSLTLTDRHKNAMGAVMGAVYFTVADFAFAAATNHQAMTTVSLTSEISFFGQPKGDKLIAEAACVRDGRTTCYYRVDVKDEGGKICAAVSITGYHVA